ncbi:Sorting nexin mvp1, partial [Linderina pennispora]
NVVLPPIYTMAYSATMKAGGGAITRDALQQLLSMTDIPRESISRILMIAEPSGGGGILTQRDFNLALAMAAMAQKNMSPTLESVAFHKDDLPLPDISGLQEFAAKAAGAVSGVAAGAAFPDDSGDPWSSVAKTKAAAVGTVTAAIGAVSVSDSAVAGSDGTAVKKERSAESNGRASVSSANTGAVSVPTINMEAVQWQLDLEDVKIQESAEKGGLVFKHTNYEVSTRSFGAMVVRRYNDFFWISNYLVKRYPYRILPNIPPKGFPGKVTDNHDMLLPVLYIRKLCLVAHTHNRIKGLTRFACAIQRTPFLSRDPLVIQFFSNTDEFSRIVKIGNFDQDAEQFDAKDEAGNTPLSEVNQTYQSFEDYYQRIMRDEERCRTQITALEKIARYKQAIGDELYAYSDTLRTRNMPGESRTGDPQFHRHTAGKRRLDSNLNELSMNFGDASLLEKSEGEVIKTISAEHLRRLYDVVVAMKLLMDRLRLADRRKEIQRVNERAEVCQKALDAMTGRLPSESGTATPVSFDRAAAERLERTLQEDMNELSRLEGEQRCVEVRFYQELAKYRCYDSFLQTLYHRMVEEQIKHHTLALNAWKQAILTADDLPANPMDFIS